VQALRRVKKQKAGPGGTGTCFLSGEPLALSLAHVDMDSTHANKITLTAEDS
jgi:hypothetical protein